MTKFIGAEIPLWGDLSFFVDGNSKITWENGTYEDPKPNAFSLPHIATCPGSTERCRSSCYVHGLKKHAPEIYHRYEKNELALHAALISPVNRGYSANVLANWILQNAPGGFRWHVSGDVFSRDYANWITAVCNLASTVPFWIYTRTIEAVAILVRAQNMAVNVSADVHNFREASWAASTFGARLCYLVSAPNEVIPELPTGSVIFPDYPLRGRSLPIATDAPWWQTITAEQRRQVCPADFFGQSEEHRCGPCKKCLRPGYGP